MLQLQQHLTGTLNGVCGHEKQKAVEFRFLKVCHFPRRLNARALTSQHSCARLKVRLPAWSKPGSRQRQPLLHSQR